MLFLLSVVLVVAGVVMLLLRVALLVLETGPPMMRPGWVGLIVGRMGQGKSLFAMWRVRKSLQYGCPVITNFHVETGAHPDAVVLQYNSWESLLRVLADRVVEAIRTGVEPRPALVVMDEAHLFAPASGQVLPSIARYIMSHARKFFVEILLITQHESRIAASVRDTVAEVVEVKRKSRTRFRATTWEPETFRKLNARPMWAQRYALKPEIISLYGSWELLRPDEHADKDGVIQQILDRIEAAKNGLENAFEEVLEAVQEHLPAQVDASAARQAGLSAWRASTRAAANDAHNAEGRPLVTDGPPDTTEATRGDATDHSNN